MNDGAPSRPGCLWPGCTNAARTSTSRTCHACRWRIGELVKRGALPADSPRTLADLRPSIVATLPALWARHSAYGPAAALARQIQRAEASLRAAAAGLSEMGRSHHP